MSAKEMVRRNKTAILATLSGDRMLILNKVYENNLITQREYNNLNSIEKEDVEGHVVRLVDKLMNKGEDSCKAFLNLLQTDAEVIKTYPELKSVQLSDTCSLTKPVQVCSADDSDVLPPESKRPKEELCTQLRRSAESSEKDDILSVLTRVNSEVSNKGFLNHKQIPQPKYTLTKKLVLKYV